MKDDRKKFYEDAIDRYGYEQFEEDKEDEENEDVAGSEPGNEQSNCR